MTTLTEITRQKERWRDAFTDWLSLLDDGSMKVRAKALWLIGEAGYAYPDLLTHYIFERVFIFTHHSNALLRARAATAMGRMGRGRPAFVVAYIEAILSLLPDVDDSVRLAAIWASENIASSAPELLADHMDAFEPLLSDPSERVRIEAPEIFRVMGKRLPQVVLPFRERLLDLSQNDENRVVRIHALGAIMAMDKAKDMHIVNDIVGQTTTEEKDNTSN